MYTIKAFVDGKEYTLHNPKIRNLIVGDPYYQKGDNVNGQASFSVYPKHPYYQYVKKLTTDIVIYKDDVEKFAGRVLYDDQDSKGVKKVFVEGELAYFCDSVQRPNVYHNISVRDYVSKIIDNHNAQVEERKQFTLGRVTVTDPNDSLYRYANWESTRDTLKTKLVERLGGHLVIRKENGVRYLDYLSDDDFYRQNTQEIRFGKNLLDYSENMDASDLVTCVIPLGATLEESSIEGLDERLTISSVNGGVDYVSSSEAIAAYGKICKTVTWDDVTVPANLLRKGKEYLKSTQFENMVLNIKAVDLNLIDSATQEFEVGDLIRCISPPHGLDTNMPLSSITVYLTNLSKNTVTLGSEKSNSTYTSSNAEKASKLDETIKSIPGKREILQEALRNATDLMNDMTKSGYAIHEKNEFIVADAAGAKTATNLWRWGLGGLAHYSHGYDGPIDGIALTMNGQINGKMLMANSVAAEKIDVAYTETIEGAISDAAASSNEYTDKQQKLLKEEVGTAIKNTENRIVLSASSLKEYVSRKNYIVNGEQETLAIGNFSISGTGANAKVELTEFLNMKCLKVSFSASATVQIKQSVGTLEASIYTICCDAAFEDGKQPANLQVGFSDSAATNDLSSYSPGTFRVFKHSVKTSEEKEKTVAITVRGTSGTALYLTNIRCLEDLAEIVDNVNSSLKIEIDNVAINVDKKFRNYSTTEETSSMIQTKINEINLAISNAYATKDQLTDKYKDAIAAAEKAAGLAEKNAKDDTTNRLKSYSTTVQMNAAIKVATDAITLGVSQTYVTQKTYEVGISNAADDATKKANAAEKNAKDDTTNRLKSYSTTVQMNAAIKVATDGITSNVSKTYVTQTTYESGISSAKDDATKKANTAEKNAKDATANSLKSYSTTEQMNSAIKQKADSIETEVSKKVGSTEIISKINQSPESVAINASKISLNGAVTANSNFKINTDGSAETKALKITGGSLGIGGNCEITRKGDVFALSPKFVSGMYLSNEVSIGVELSKKSYSMIMGYVGKDIFVGESASTLRGYGFTANNDIYAYGKLGCMGEKTRIIHTDDGRNAEMYAYETASPTFGDIGTGKIDNDGYCYVYLENDFLATIEKNMKYHVTLTAKGPGELYIESTNENDGYFLVKGTPKLEFYWEVRVRQKGCRDTRIEESNIPEKEDVTAEDQEMINEQIRNQAILLCEMEKDENEVRDEQSNLIERMEELS
ncbi:phage tail protein [Fusicatenibacter saccharivorans]|uniref:Prophage endopeptidase tail n=1 Tax=Fusicatenibacter saccharivorans TaxID=1150298 RepID=A0A174JW22_9FIRM|nr:phage tail protein [Fusicatenibacter saccharivorans]CUP04003.1 Prophage endopeptidase tail [Fusicatenibacter saccharivorans]